MPFRQKYLTKCSEPLSLKGVGRYLLKLYELNIGFSVKQSLFDTWLNYNGTYLH